MTDPRELANKARATLAGALQALQNDTDSDALMEVAEPIAKTMSLLHRIESGELRDGQSVQQALDNVRTALDTLQKVQTSGDSADTAMEAVAGSLSMLFTLHRALAGPPAGSTARPAAAAPAAAPAPGQAFGGTHVMAAPSPQLQNTVALPPERIVVHGPTAAQASPGHRSAMENAATMAPTQHGGYGHAAAAPPAQSPGYPAAPPAQSPGYPAAPPAHGQGYPAAPPAQSPGYPAAPAQPGYPADHHVPGMTGAPPPPAGAPYVEVELGAHSGSNFYKGLSGNDVIDHGGIFVATYQIPKKGSAVALRIHLPGDLELYADAIVQWTRDTRGGESEPGFGAKFTRITPEGRQLVYRYVRNREPIFYDDM